ncbi:MAG: aminotransferase class V-fold PLP-dependent enzyme [Longimicrobiales bacterium]
MLHPNRRRFVGQLFGGAAAALATPSWISGATLEPWSPGSPGNKGEALPEGLGAPGSPEDEVYWTRVREQFPLAPGLILMNAANLCPSPYPVQDAVFRHTRDVDGDASFQNRAKFGPLKEEARRALAAYVGADAREIAITRNTSEGNNSVVNGLDLGPGDEVVIWDQNHPTNNVAWDVRARRWGFTVKRVSTPSGAEATPEALMMPFLDALSPNTRVLAFSHVSNVSGTALPARRLCEVARGRGILSLVDGAQTFGAVKLNLHAMGCDFFTASSHKWFVGPKEAGLLFVREGSQELLWPSDVGVGWEGAEGAGAQKFENMGQRDDAAVVSMATAAAFHEAIGPDAVEARVRALAGSVRETLRERIPDVVFFTPEVEASRAGVVVFEIPGRDHDAIFEGVYQSHRLGCAAMHGLFTGLRLSPHLYNTMDQVEAAVEAVAAHV